MEKYIYLQCLNWKQLWVSTFIWKNKKSFKCNNYFNESRKKWNGEQKFRVEYEFKLCCFLTASIYGSFGSWNCSHEQLFHNYNLQKQHAYNFFLNNLEYCYCLLVEIVLTGEIKKQIIATSRNMY